ncbi:MAG: 30S ribosome-binding factor RbfA [Lachnospiraceae bacterium]|nr:30S ribosome-binding factor RbfA [Lachnospiraceae bacterium]
MRKNSIKNIRVSSEVQKELSKIIREEVKDPRVGMLTSVTHVEVAPDLKTCKAYISSIDNNISVEETVDALKRAEGFVRHCLADSLNLRITPHITFIADHSIEYGVNMNKKIADEMEHIRNNPAGEGTDFTE